MTGFVYAIENADGLVKIGWSAKPYHRLSKINSDTSSPCELVGTVAATRKQERELHAMLQNSRVHGEWYRKDASIEVVLRYFARRKDVQPPIRRPGRPKKQQIEPNPNPTTRELLSEIEAFCAAKNMPTSRFGLLVMHDGSFVRRLHDGKGITLRSAAKIKAFMQRSLDEAAA